MILPPYLAIIRNVSSFRNGQWCFKCCTGEQHARFWVVKLWFYFRNDRLYNLVWKDGCISLVPRRSMLDPNIQRFCSSDRLSTQSKWPTCTSLSDSCWLWCSLGFHWVQYLIPGTFFSTTSAEVPIEPYRYQTWYVNYWSLISRGKSALQTCDKHNRPSRFKSAQPAKDRMQRICMSTRFLNNQKNSCFVVCWGSTDVPLVHSRLADPVSESGWSDAELKTFFKSHGSSGSATITTCKLSRPLLSGTKLQWKRKPSRAVLYWAVPSGVVHAVEIADRLPENETLKRSVSVFGKC